MATKIIWLLSISQLVIYTSAQWIPPIEIKNYKFFETSTGLEFQVRGVAYYPRPNSGNLSTVDNYDYFTSDFKSRWMEDIEHFVKLGVNVVRIYSVDPSLNHDEFMCELSKNGMYAFIGMSATCKGCSIENTSEAPNCYPDSLFERAQMIYNAFAVYDNVLGFSVGNENNMAGKKTAPCVKALIRDIQTYAFSCQGSLRKVPIGLDSADIDDEKLGMRSDWAQFYNCVPEGEKNSRADWLGWNAYVECEQDTTLYSQSKGYQKLVKDFEAMSYSIPVVLGEFGCNTFSDPPIDGFAQQRSWHQASWLFESPMADHFSGGTAFEYSTEDANVKVPYPFKEYDAQQYGLGYFSPEDCDHFSTPCVYTPYPQFQFLAKYYLGAANKSTLLKKDFEPDSARTSIPSCPALIDVSLIPPTPKVELLSCSVIKPLCNGAPPKGASVNDAKVSDQSTQEKKDGIVVPMEGTTSGSAALLVASPSTILFHLLFGSLFSSFMSMIFYQFS